VSASRKGNVWESWNHYRRCVRFSKALSLLISGIGLALAQDLHEKGWKLTIVDMNSTQGEAIVAHFGEENALFIKADVSKWEENVKFFKATKEKFGHIDFGTTPSHDVLMKLRQTQGSMIVKIYIRRHRQTGRQNRTTKQLKSICSDRFMLPSLRFTISVPRLKVEK